MFIKMYFKNVNNTNMFSCVGIGSPFILVTVAVLNSMLQCSLCYKVQFLVVIYIFHSFWLCCWFVSSF